jgi:hypothetical protein
MSAELPRSRIRFCRAGRHASLAGQEAAQMSYEFGRPTSGGPHEKDRGSY